MKETMTTGEHEKEMKNNSTRILFLDDMKSRRDAFAQAVVGSGYVVDYATDADMAIKFLKMPRTGADRYRAIYLDHDLEEDHYNSNADHHKDGRYVARFMVSSQDIIDTHRAAIVILHTLNPGGRAAMTDILKKEYVFLFRGCEDFCNMSIWKADVTAVLGAVEKYLSRE